MPRRRNPIPSDLPHKQTGKARAVWPDPAGTRHFRLLPSPFDNTAMFGTTTLGGRRRLIPSHKRKLAPGGGSEYYPNVTEALNSPVQGTGADGLKAALALLWERRAECPGAAPVLVCHDEIVVEAPAGAADRAADWLTACMVDGMAPLVAPVPVAVAVSTGPTWAG